MREKALLKRLNFIEIYQFFGGVTGVLLMIYLLFTTSVRNYQDSYYILLVTPFLYFTFCIYSAWLLNKKKYLRGLNLVIISLFLQVIAFHFDGLFYTAVNGIGLNFTLDLYGDIIAGFDFQFSQFFITFTGNENVKSFKVNLFAIGMLFYMFKTLKELRSNSLNSIV